MGGRAERGEQGRRCPSEAARFSDATSLDGWWVLHGAEMARCWGWGAGEAAGRKPHAAHSAPTASGGGEGGPRGKPRPLRVRGA